MVKKKQNKKETDDIEVLCTNLYALGRNNGCMDLLRLFSELPFKERFEMAWKFLFFPKNAWKNYMDFFKEELDKISEE